MFPNCSLGSRKARLVRNVEANGGVPMFRKIGSEVQFCKQVLTSIERRSSQVGNAASPILDKLVSVRRMTLDFSTLSYSMAQRIGRACRLAHQNLRRGSIMRNVSLVASVAMAGLLSACGGDDSAPSGPAPTPTLSVTLSETADTIVVQEGETKTFGFNATYTGTSSQPIVADVTYNGERYTLDGSPSLSGKIFTVNFETVPLAAGGEKSSEITFRLCTSANCSTVYPGSSQTFNLTLDVALGDWGMFQRNAAHTGYIAAKYDPADFSDAWAWDVTDGSTLELSATRGKVFVTKRNYFGNSEIRALSSADGSVLWTRGLGNQAYVSGPSYLNGKVFVTSMVSSSSRNPQWVLDADTGNVVQQMVFSSQWHDFGQPTVFEDSVYVAAGYYGNIVYNFDYLTGGKIWESSGSGADIWDGQSVAVDGDHVYYYSGAALDVFDRTSGELLKSMADPFYDWRGYSWESAPILDGNGFVFGFSSPHDYYSDTRIAGYSVDEGKQLWISNASYTTAAAFAHERLFAARSGLQLIDAIVPASGTIDYSVGFPNGDSARSNIVIADNLLFVSGTTKTYAFDLSQSGYPVVWESDVTGMHLAISPDNLLLISSPTHVQAVSLAP